MEGQLAVHLQQQQRRACFNLEIIFRSLTAIARPTNAASAILLSRFVMILSFQVTGDYLQLRKRPTCGRVLRAAIRDVKRKAGRVSDDGESSQLTGIEHQTTLVQRTAYAFHCAGRHNNGPSSRSAFPIFKVGNGAEMAGFRDRLAVVERWRRGEEMLREGDRQRRGRPEKMARYGPFCQSGLSAWSCGSGWSSAGTMGVLCLRVHLYAR